MIIFKESGYLSNELIGEWVKGASDACQKYTDGQKKSLLKVQFSIEEVLLNFLETYGANTECQIKGIKSRNGIVFIVSQRGIEQNPLKVDFDSELQYNLLAQLNLKPSYVYRARTGINQVSIPVLPSDKKNRMLRNVIIALVLSLFTGFISKYIPESVLKEYITPTVSLLFKKMTSIFMAVATPLVFCAVITGISDLSDINSFGKIGSVFLRRMFGDYGIAMIVMVLLGIPMGLVTTGSFSEGENVFSQLFDLILDIIPNNLIEPFRTDNDLQVVTLAVFIGVILLIVRDKAQMVKTFISEVELL